MLTKNCFHEFNSTNVFYSLAIVNSFSQAEEKMPKDFADAEFKIIFILLSPLLTWGTTKPIDPVSCTLIIVIFQCALNYIFAL